MRIAEVCQECLYYINAKCIIYNDEYLSVLDVSSSENLEDILVKINNAVAAGCCATTTTTTDSPITTTTTTVEEVITTTTTIADITTTSTTTENITTTTTTTTETITTTSTTTISYIELSVKLGTSLVTICEHATTIRYSNTVFGIGTILYEDTALTSPVTDFGRVVDMDGGGDIYNLDDITGEVLSATGNNCFSTTTTSIP